MESTQWGYVVWFGLVRGVSYALFATGLTLVFGILFVVNFAHGQVFMLAAIITYSMMTFFNLNFFLAASIAIISVAAFGFVINRVAIQPLIERSPWLVLLSTIGLGMMVLHGVLYYMGPSAHFVITPFTGLTNVGELTVSTEGIVLFGIGLAAIIAVHLFLRRAKLGKDMQATIQNRVGASLCGINTKKVYDYTLVIASGLAALGGVLSAVVTIADPYMGGGMLIKGFVVTIVAGMGNIVGAAVLGLAIGVAESIFSATVTPYFRETFLYGIMVISVLFKPKGLFYREED